MGLKDRIRKAEKRAGHALNPLCPEHGGMIRTVEIYSDGSHSWIAGGPCSRCDGTLFEDPEPLKAWAQTPAQPLEFMEVSGARAESLSLLVYLLDEPPPKEAKP